MTTLLSSHLVSSRQLAARSARRRAHRRDLMAAVVPLLLDLIWIVDLGCGIGLAAVLLVIRFCF